MLHVSVTHSFTGDGQVVGVVQAIVIHMAPLVLDAMPPIPLLPDVMPPVPMVPPAPDALEAGLPLLPLIAAPAPPVG
jgi:hypothetical protein